LGPGWGDAPSSPASQRSSVFPSIQRWQTELIAKGSDPTSAPDLWTRMRMGFALDIPDNPRIQRELEWYVDRPDYVGRVQQRARLYLHYIITEVEERELPSELALLPVIESAFQPFAYSPAKAAGLWQFIPSTGKIYGLKQDWWYDGRRDVTESTRAALDYLQALNNIFDGDWLLALASYNAGAGTVSRAIAKNERKGKPTDFWSLDLPAETESYVPRFLAVAKLVAYPEVYGVALDPIPNEPYFATVQVDTQLDLTMAAKLTGLSVSELHNLNAGLKYGASPPNEPHHIHLPVNAIAGFQSSLAQLPPGDRIEWRRYRVQRGEDLGRVASRFNTSDDLLREVNRMESSRLRSGSHLLVPVADEEALAAVIASNKTPSRRSTTGRSSASRGDGDQRYVVRSGDTLWSIARKFRVSLKDLAQYNGISKNTKVRTGTVLTLAARSENAPKSSSSPSKKKTSKGASKSQSSRRAASKGSGKSKKVAAAKVYRVRKGDSLSTIATRFDVSVSDIKRWNDIRGTQVNAGQQLTVNDGTPRISAKTRYRVRQGDSLYAIAKRFDVSVSDIKRWNDIRGTQVNAGQQLTLNLESPQLADNRPL